MKTIRGLYENGEVKLLEKSPLPGVQKVLITFIEDEDLALRNLTISQSSKAMKEYLQDDKEDIYQDYLK